MKIYYQPIRHIPCGDGEYIDELPDGLFSFQAFISPQETDAWLIEHGYDPIEFDIHEYYDDQIEDVVLIDAHGNSLD